MPLLKKKPFEKSPIPENLRDDEEVFYCAVTNEIFRDYEAFSERMFLCNSMVWTCSLTGKSNLTYSEALESEENAKNSLKEFPSELKIPILYLALKTRRTAFGDMAEDIFLFAKDKYFIGENVETSFCSQWKDSHVLQVIAPNKFKSPPKNGSAGDKNHALAMLYKYEIEHLDAEDGDISEIMIVDCNQIRRKKGSFSREKCKIFLKQYVRQDERGMFTLKPSAIEAFHLNNVTFDQIFDGPLPQFEASKKVEKVFNGKKTHQESLHKFLTKNGEVTKKSNNNLLEKMRKKQEEFQLMKQQKKEKDIEMKQKRKEENLLLAGHLKNWYKPKDDLELEDHQVLPKADPIKLKVPDEHLGDMFMVLEFVSSFSKVISAKDFFPGGLSVELMERALTENEVAGPFIDLLQMLLVALFNVQDAEASQYRTEIESLSSLKQEEVSDNMNLREATRLATVASSWSKKYQGIPLARLPLYSLTTSEVLRLHLLSSGAIINNTGARWRYQQRGGYTSEDDPGLYFRLHNPHILKALSTHNVVELSIADKLQILSCLTNQLLTYADIRDVIEERIEGIKQAKADYKSIQVAEKKREQEFLAARLKLKKAVNEDPKATSELLKLEMEAEKRKGDNEYKLEQARKASYVKQTLMGNDRAYRQYLRLESIPGLFVNCEEENSGRCLSKAIKLAPHLINASRNELLSHIRTTTDLNSSDKENSQSPKKVNGQVNGHQNENNFDELLLCSADATTCVVHSVEARKNRWCFYHDGETFHNLLVSLNNRGMREGELLRHLKDNKEQIQELIGETPVYSLNSALGDKDDEPRRVKKTGKVKYENANLGYPSEMDPADILQNALIENLLEMEEKIYAGNLGALAVKDRNHWRSCLQNKDYKEFDKTLHRHNPEEKHSTVNGTTEAEDYGYSVQFVHSTPDCFPDIDNNVTSLTQPDGIQEDIKCLSIALAQIGRSVEPKCLKKPLGRMSGGRNGDRKKENILDLWERSLLAATSFSQVFLHYSTLDSCIMWGKSVLLTRCRICRRRNDSENMLLCDSCKLGHHLYCLKPKLKSVPSGDWYCNKCQKERQKVEVPVETPQKKRRIFMDEEIDDEEEATANEEDFNESEKSNEDDDDDVIEIITVHLCKTCGSGGEVICCEKCTNHYHVECVEPPLRRPPRGSWLCTLCKKYSEKKRFYDSNDEEVVIKRSSRRDDSRSDLPLHNSELHAVLAEIMKDSNAWPFVRPVQKIEVPDYYDVITKPMDFGTIKYKLNMGEYREDADFMSDALLVFENCNTYNRSKDDVYKCGVQLLKHFQKKCKEVGLKLPYELDYESRPKKKIRTK